MFMFMYMYLAANTYNPTHIVFMDIYLNIFVWQRKKASGSVFVPTSLKNLMVTGVFGEKVRLREGHASCTHLQLLFDTFLYTCRALT